jgi:hypothetical protein
VCTLYRIEQTQSGGNSLVVRRERESWKHAEGLLQNYVMTKVLLVGFNFNSFITMHGANDFKKRSL